MMNCFGCGKPLTESWAHDEATWCGECLKAAKLPEVHSLWFDAKNAIQTEYKATLKRTLDIARQLYDGVTVWKVVQRGAMRVTTPDQVRIRVGREL